MRHLLAGAMVLAFATGANAAVLTWSADLEPGNEVPPLSIADAGGSATGTIDTDSGALTWDVSWSGLTGDAIGAHFHGPAPAGTNAGVIVNIGEISGLTPPSAGSTSITPAQVSEVLSRLWYINVHTPTNPSGEIRGQVMPAPIPLPGSLPLLVGAAAVLGLGWGRRKV